MNSHESIILIKMTANHQSDWRIYFLTLQSIIGKKGFYKVDLLKKISSSIMKKKIQNKIGVSRKFYPTQLAIETVCDCNAKCIMCPSKNKQRAKGTMSIETHKRIIDSVKSWGAPVNMITHAGMGEPLLDARLEEKISYEKNIFPEAQIIVYSNGSILSEKRGISLIDSGLDIISFSINAFYENTYMAVMNLSREKVYSNVERFLELRREKKSDMQVCVSLTKTDLCSDQEIKEYNDYWKDRVNSVIFPPWISWGGTFDHSIKGTQLPCLYIWQVLMVDYDGTVKMCCEDYDSRFPMGNILDKNPDEIFNSKRMVDQRSAQLRGDFTWPNICRNCIETFQSAETYWKNSSPIPYNK